MKGEILQVLVIVFGATGFWKLIEFLVQYSAQKKLKSAEVRNLDARANDLVVGNWMQWSEKMEKRIAELEAQNAKMQVTIVKQREEINELRRRYVN